MRVKVTEKKKRHSTNLRAIKCTSIFSTEVYILWLIRRGEEG